MLKRGVGGKQFSRRPRMRCPAAGDAVLGTTSLVSTYVLLLQISAGAAASEIDVNSVQSHPLLLALVTRTSALNHIQTEFQQQRRLLNHAQLVLVQSSNVRVNDQC